MASSPPEEPSRLQMRNAVAQIMYGFGDDKEPLPESVELVEDMTLEFVRNTVERAAAVSRRGRVRLEDVLLAAKSDRAKQARAEYLVRTDRRIDELKKMKGPSGASLK